MMFTWKFVRVPPVAQHKKIAFFAQARGYSSSGPYKSLEDVPVEDVEAVGKFRTKFNRSNIPYKSFDISFHRSSGAGGQNVNKVNTKVYMRFALNEQSWIPDYIKGRLRELYNNRINKTGEYLITSEKTRSQKHNIDDCLDKLWESLDHASSLPKPPDEETAKRVEDLKKAEKARNTEKKKRRSDKKSNRRKRFDDF